MLSIHYYTHRLFITFLYIKEPFVDSLRIRLDIIRGGGNEPYFPFIRKMPGRYKYRVSWDNRISAAQVIDLFDSHCGCVVPSGELINSIPPPDLIFPIHNPLCRQELSNVFQQDTPRTFRQGQRMVRLSKGNDMVFEPGIDLAQRLVTDVGHLGDGMEVHTPGDLNEVIFDNRLFREGKPKGIRILRYNQRCHKLGDIIPGLRLKRPGLSHLPECRSPCSGKRPSHLAASCVIGCKGERPCPKFIVEILEVPCGRPCRLDGIFSLINPFINLESVHGTCSGHKLPEAQGPFGSSCIKIKSALYQGEQSKLLRQPLFTEDLLYMKKIGTGLIQPLLKGIPAGSCKVPYIRGHLSCGV